MFKLVGTPKRVAFAKLVFDGHQDFDTEEVREMEASFADTGGEPLHYPLVAKQEGKGTFKVVAGRTRLKALKRAGKKEVLVQLVAGEEKELQTAAIIENLRRRQVDQKDLLTALDNIRQGITGQAASNCADSQREDKEKPSARRGRPSEGKAESRERVAKLTGQTAEAIRKQEERARAAAEKEAAEPAESAPTYEPKPTIDLHGLDVPADVLKAAEKEQALIAKMDHLIRELKSTYTDYENHRGERKGMKAGQYQFSALRDALGAFGTIRQCRPVSVCLSCKLLPDVRKTCATCRGTGYMDEKTRKDMEGSGGNALLLEGDEAGVWVDGKWRTLISLRGEDF